MNECKFSTDRKYRYYLKHRWDDLLPENAMMWIGLNPSTADENKLDPTLRRVKSFCTREGYNCFYMLNLFAFRATNPRDMMEAEDPIGPENDYWLKAIARNGSAPVCCWGAFGNFKKRDEEVYDLLTNYGFSLQCLIRTKSEAPGHPLYVNGEKMFEAFTMKGAE